MEANEVQEDASEQVPVSAEPRADEGVTATEEGAGEDGGAAANGPLEGVDLKQQEEGGASDSAPQNACQEQGAASEAPAAVMEVDQKGGGEEEEAPAAVVKEEEPRPKQRRQRVRSTDPRQGVDLVVSDATELEAAAPITLGAMFRKTVEKAPDHPALCFKENQEGEWQTITYAQYYRYCIQAAKSFLKVGMVKGREEQSSVIED